MAWFIAGVRWPSRATGTAAGSIMRGIHVRAPVWRLGVPPFNSVRVRLTLWYVAVLALILVIFSGVIYATEQAYLLAQFDNTVHTRLQQFASAYTEQGGHVTAEWASPGEQRTRVAKTGIVTGKPVRAPFGLASGPKREPQNMRNTKLFCGQFMGPQAGIAMVLTPRGRVLHAYACPPAALGAPDLRDLATEAQANAMLVLQGQAPPVEQHRVAMQLPDGATQPLLLRITSLPLVVQHHIVALVLLGLASDVPRQMAALARTLEVALPLILLLCAGGGYWLATRALRPVQVITRTVQQIGATDLSRRLNLNRRDELGDLGATFDQMLQRLDAAFERQRQFTADVSHELRTPLTLVELEATQALAQPGVPAEARRALAVMQQENRAMARLVNDLLTLARADSGQAPLQRADVDLGEVVLDVAERLTPLAHQNALTLTVAPVADLPLCGDREYLLRMVMNLTENALKYSAGTGTEVCIDAGRRCQAGVAGVWLRVADDGPGLRPEHLPYVFDRFYRVDQARTHHGDVGEEAGAASSRPTGSGLGLAITQWIVEAHGGSIRVQSELGHGAAFEIWLPAAL